jgi:DNA replication protein DnaC
MKQTVNQIDRINELLKELRLSGMRGCFQERAESAAREQSSYLTYLQELLEDEYTQRRQRSIDRRLHISRLPAEKTFTTFKTDRLTQKVKHQLKLLEDGDFVKRNENVLVFGSPGSGKTHLLAALSHQLVYSGYHVLCTCCSHLVQELLRQKTAYQLDKYIKKLDRFDVIMIDDIGYVQQSREEMEVLFTLLSARYEQGSVMLTSNLPFSKWDRIFKDPMTTAAVVDRLIHHSIIIELNLSSFRMEQAQKRKSVE